MKNNTEMIFPEKKKKEDNISQHLNYEQKNENKNQIISI